VIRFADTEPRYVPGQLVRHRRYDYRAVVVAVDCRCLAEHDWYMSNRSQPDQNQPWYHLLVDGSATSTYAAECNLEVDKSGEPVDHPLIHQFFDGFSAGCHCRNDRPWQGW